MKEQFDMELEALFDLNKDIDVPEKISRGIEETLNKITQKSKRTLFIKRSILAASLVFVTILSLGTAFPALADNLPIVNIILGENSIFNRNYSETDEYSHFNNLSSTGNYAIAVNKAVGDIQVRELAYDGVAFYSVYEVEGDFKEKDDNYFMYDSSIFVNDTEYTPGVLIPEQIDDNVLRVTQVYPIPGGSEIPDEFVASIKFSMDGKFQQGLEVSLYLDKEQLISSVKKVELNKQIKLGLHKAKLLSFTQAQAYASMTVEYSKYEPDKYAFVLLDDRGNELEEVDMGRVEKKGFKTIVTRVYKSAKDANITRILVLERNNNDYYREAGINLPSTLKSKEYIGLDSQLPIKVSVGEGRELAVTTVKKNENGYEIIIKAKDIAVCPYVLMGGIFLYDRSRDKKDDASYLVSRADALGDNSYRLSFNQSKDFGYEDAALCFGNYDELLSKLYEFTAE